MILIPNSNGEPIVEVNHCHGPGKGHPCEGEGSAAGTPAAPTPYVSRPRLPLKQRLAKTAKAMRQARLDRGGVVAQKQRDLEYRMAKGRDTQRQAQFKVAYDKGFYHGQTGYGFQKADAGRKGSKRHAAYREGYDAGVDASGDR